MGQIGIMGCLATEKRSPARTTLGNGNKVILQRQTLGHKNIPNVGLSIERTETSILVITHHHHDAWFLSRLGRDAILKTGKYSQKRHNGHCI